MLRLIFVMKLTLTTLKNLNTSHVKVNPEKLDIDNSNELFKYISC